MNILYIDHYAGSDRRGMEFRPFYMAREWVKMGHDVTILAADYSHLRRENPVITEDFTEEYEDSVRFVWVKTPPYVGNRVKRINNMYTFIGKISISAGMLADKYRPDAVISSSTYPMDIYPAQKIAAKSGALLCYEIHDIWPLSLMVLGSRPAWEPAMVVVQQAEDFCFKNSDKIVSVLPDADRHIRERGFNTDFTCIPNGVVLDGTGAVSEPLDEETEKTLDKLKSDGKFIVMYAGGHALSNALDCFVEAGSAVPDGAVLVLVGSGSEKQRLVDSAAEKGLENVIFLDPVKKTMMQPLLKKADCLYLGAMRSKLYSYGVGMNKIYDYMLSSRPIIYGVESSNHPVDDAQCGLTIEAESSAAVAEAVEKMMSLSPDERDTLGKNGHDFCVKNHDYRVLSERFLAVLSDKNHSLASKPKESTEE